MGLRYYINALHKTINTLISKSVKVTFTIPFLECVTNVSCPGQSVALRNVWWTGILNLQLFFLYPSQGGPEQNPIHYHVHQRVSADVPACTWHRQEADQALNVLRWQDCTRRSVLEPLFVCWQEKCYWTYFNLIGAVRELSSLEVRSHLFI